MGYWVIGLLDLKPTANLVRGEGSKGAREEGRNGRQEGRRSRETGGRDKRGYAHPRGEGKGKGRIRKSRRGGKRKGETRGKGKGTREENKRARQGREGNEQREPKGKGGRQQSEDAGQRELAEESMWRHRCHGQLKSEQVLWLVNTYLYIYDNVSIYTHISKYGKYGTV